MSMRSLIKLHGSKVTIYKRTEGALDGHGDPAVTWTAEAKQERVWIQDTATASTPAVVRSLGGNIEVSKYIGYLLPDTVIVTGDNLEDEDGRRFRVGRILVIPLLRDPSHKEAHLMLMEEGS